MTSVLFAKAHPSLPTQLRSRAVVALLIASLGHFACSGSEAPAEPVPVDAGTDARRPDTLGEGGSGTSLGSPDVRSGDARSAD